MGFILVPKITAQDSTVSLVYKNNRNHRTMYFYQPDLSYQLWQQFTLMKKANDGDPLAMHELGLRYLLGTGVAADTVKGAYWVGKAADKEVTAACFNYGILLLNGWGVNWNPFKAFNYFMEAAKSGMDQAQYIVGLLYTDDLVIKRNWSKAYSWVKKAADQGYKPAKNSLKELLEKIPKSLLQPDSLQTNEDKKVAAKENNSLSSSLGLVFIDFSSINDSTRKVTDKMLIQDLTHEGNETLSDTLGISSIQDSTIIIDTSRMKILKDFANTGSPEALAMLGRMYQQGIYAKQDILLASAYYLRAIKLDSPTASVLLWNLSKSKHYYEYLEKEVKKNNPIAEFIWYGLFSVGYNNYITASDAINFLERSAGQNYIPAIIELGLEYYTGKIIQQNKSKGIDLWKKAENMGSKEAGIRIRTSYIFDDFGSSNLKANINYLYAASEQGSVLAQVALAYCFENGIGKKASEADAVKYYRYAAQRGNRYAYDELKRMYDAIRPETKEFRIN